MLQAPPPSKAGPEAGGKKQCPLAAPMPMTRGFLTYAYVYT